MAQVNQKTIKLAYNVIDRSAKKIATLVKIANLNYQIEQNHDDSVSPHILHTPSGQLTKEYQIINFIITQSRQLSKNKPKPEENPTNEQPSETDSTQRPSREAEAIKSEGVVNLQGTDAYSTAQMHEKLYELRVSLFPLLQEFYKYLTGNQKTKKNKYDSLMNKIKKQIGKLDTDINDHPDIFHSQSNFLNIIIACQILMACKFVFQEKFRKSKYTLFNKFQKISHRRQFIEVHGKSDLCQKQYVPSEFQEDEPAQNQGREAALPQEIIKMSNNVLNAQPDSNRNQLLYNYFKTIFSQNESKKPYFPYFWLMFDDLNCSLIQVVQTIQDSSQDNGPLKLKLLHKKLTDQLNTQIDYGMLGLYQSQKDKKFLIRGLICLGSKTSEQFQASFQKPDSIEVKFHKVDANIQKQKKEVENLWEHTIQNTVQEQIHLNLLQLI